VIEGNGHRPLASEAASPATGPVRTPSRRRRYAIIAVLLLGVVAALVVGYIRDRGWVRVSSVETLDAHEVVYLPTHGIFVVANRNSPVALLAVSPHAGERVLFCRRAGAFQDEHGDAFDSFGRYLAGPSPRGMDRVAVRIKGDDVNVKPARVDPGPARSIRASRPRGGFCDPDGVEGAPGFFAEGG
ncbi:MAG TPA: hypothetical protein VEQ37_07150, partial [Actinomycetota bacterium]|nr:hypothetical protein [Actinomycetota bacterium]